MISIDKAFSSRELILNSFKSRNLPRIHFNHLKEWLQEVFASKKHYQELVGRWKGETVFCIGNGPSLNHQDLKLLDNKIVIGTNKSYKLLQRFQPKSFHLVIQDSSRLKEIQPDLTLSSLQNSTIWISSHDTFKDHHPFVGKNRVLSNSASVLTFWPLPTAINYDQTRHHLFLTTECSKHGFSPNLDKGLYLGHSVIFSAIQLAYIGGAKNIVCLGIDMDYTSHGTSFDPASPNLWPDFSYETHCKDMICYFRDYLAVRHVKLWNATLGGKVNEIPRIPLEKASCF